MIILIATKIYFGRSLVPFFGYKLLLKPRTNLNLITCLYPPKNLITCFLLNQWHNNDYDNNKYELKDCYLYYPD